jgi:hypothetical protein
MMDLPLTITAQTCVPVHGRVTVTETGREIETEIVTVTVIVTEDIGAVPEPLTDLGDELLPQEEAMTRRTSQTKSPNSR